MTTTAGVLQIQEPEKGSYTVTQVEEPSTLPKVVNDGDRMEIKFDIGLVRITGYVVPSTLEIGVEPYVFGFKIGSYYGSLANGLGIAVSLFLVKGGIKFELNGKDVNLKVNLSGVGLPNVNEEAKLFSLP